MAEVDPKLDPNNEFNYSFPILGDIEAREKLRSDVQNYNELKNQSEKVAQDYLKTTVYKPEEMVLAQALLKYNDRDISLSSLQERAFEVQMEFNEQFLDNRRILHHVTDISQDGLSDKDFITLINDKLSSRKKLTQNERIIVQTFYGIPDENGNAHIGILPEYAQDNAERKEMIDYGQGVLNRVLSKLKALPGAENIVADTIASQGNIIKLMNVMNTTEARKEIADFDLIKEKELERIKTKELMPAVKAAHKASPEGSNKLFTAVFIKELPKKPEMVVEDVAVEEFEEKEKPSFRERLKNTARGFWREVKTRPAILGIAGGLLFFTTIGILGNRQNKKSNDPVNAVKQNVAVQDTAKKLGQTASITKVVNTIKPAVKKAKHIIVQEEQEQDEPDSVVNVVANPTVDSSVTTAKVDVKADTVKQAQIVLEPAVVDTSAKQTVVLNAMATKVDSAKAVSVVDTAVKKDVVKTDSVATQSPAVVANTVTKDSTAKIDSVVKTDTVKAQANTAQNKFKANADTATKKSFFGKTFAKFKKAGLAVAQKEADLTKSAVNLVAKKPEPEVKAKTPQELIDEKYKLLQDALDKNSWEYKYQSKQLDCDKKIERLKLKDNEGSYNDEKIHKIQDQKTKIEKERTEDPHCVSSHSANARAMVVPAAETTAEAPVLAAVDVMIESGQSIVEPSANRRRPNPGQSAMVRRHSNSSLAQRRF